MMNTNIEVKVGQVWRDNDKRANRNCEIREVNDKYARVYCRETQKLTKVRLDRFKPTASGYKLVQDVS